MDQTECQVNGTEPPRGLCPLWYHTKGTLNPGRGLRTGWGAWSPRAGRMQDWAEEEAERLSLPGCCVAVTEVEQGRGDGRRGGPEGAGLGGPVVTSGGVVAGPSPGYGRV